MADTTGTDGGHDNAAAAATPISLEDRGEGVIALRMEDTAGKNVFSSPFVDAIIAQLARFEEAFPDARCLVVEGLPDVFAAGADKESLLEIASGRFHVKDLLISEKMMNVPVPVIAAMEGHAVGGGFVMGLCCDIVILAEQSRYGVNFMEMGFTPGMGCTRLLQGLVGPYIANEMMFTASRLKGRAFKGLVNHIVPRDEVKPKADQVARAIAEKPRLSLELLKYSVSLGKRQLLQESRVHEDFMHRLTFQTPGMQQRIEELYL